MLRIAYDVVKPILSFHICTEAEKYFQTPWKNTFPGKQHLGLIDILQLSESPVIFLSSITPETCPVAITLDSKQISLTGTLKSPKSGEWFAAALGSLVRFLMVQLCGQHCGQAGSVCGACASPLILVIVWDGLPTFWPIEVCLDSNIIYSVRGFSTCCRL